MIFNRLFVNKYQHKDPVVRIAAIADLSRSDIQQKQILHELAFNDEDVNVQIAALEHLASFPLWSKVAQTAKHDRLKKHAVNVVERALNGESQLALSQQEKTTYLLESSNNKLLEQMLKHDRSITSDKALSIRLLEKLNKPHVNQHVMINADNPELQMALVEQEDNERLLNKALKRIKDEGLAERVQKRLVYLQELREKPDRVRQQASMLLSQLNALKDGGYQQLITKREKLASEFDQLTQEFSCLGDDLSSTLLHKFKEIQGSLDIISDNLKQDYLLAEAAHKVTRDLQEYQDALLVVQKSVADALAGDISAITLGQVEVFENRLEQLEIKLSDFKQQSDKQVRKKVESLYSTIINIRATLERLPEFRLAVEEAERLLVLAESFEIPATPEGAHQARAHVKQMQSDWRQVVERHKAIWPKALNTRWKEQRNRLYDELEARETIVKQSVKKINKKLQSVKHLIQQGRFHPAMATFSKVSEVYQQLPESSRQSLTRRFEKVAGQITELKDWQTYVSATRKPSLVEEAKALIADPLPVKQQAQAVKLLRSRFNSLGKIEQDTNIQSTFDDLLEQAFEPCRQHYAELEKQRESFYQEKQTLLAELVSERFSALQGSELEKAYNQVLRQWSRLGEVEFSKRNEIKHAFENATASITSRINEFYEDNAGQKQQLIEQLKQLMGEDLTSDATVTAKQLQQRWKRIGFAGKKTDQALWKTFRSLNDQIFGRHSKDIEAAKARKDALHSQLKSYKDELSGALASCKSLSDIDTLTESFENRRTELTMQAQNLSRQAITELNKLDKSLVKRRKALKEDKHQQQLLQVFELLSGWQDSEIEGDVAALPGKWQRAFGSAPSDNDRHTLTLNMEIVSETASPDVDSERRKLVQLQMMSDRLQSGKHMEMETLLVDWISHGPLSQNDQRLLERIRPLFIGA